MIGLPRKDLYVLKSQKLFVTQLIFVVIALVIGYEEPILGVFAGTILASTLSITTIAYDDYNNSSIFLFTLPISRKTYVVSKYLFSLLFCVAVSMIVSLIIFFWHFSLLTAGGLGTWLLQVLIVTLAPMLFASLMIPINLKFGTERGRIVMVVLFVAIGILSPFASDLIQPARAQSFLLFISRQDTWLLLLLFVAVISLVALFSVVISAHVMRKKEF